jgi:hypothetical protein
MLTSYMVKCPHAGCGWQGSLLPSRDRDAWRGSLPSVSRVTFACPRCGGEWHARVVGDDVVSLPLESELVTTA